ncbi:MAG: hypothetical protein KDI13_02835 [Alphaproteobacteria bacterium]|nr:hypothetical protein [Alphaproteobacteria bacterium]
MVQGNQEAELRRVIEYLASSQKQRIPDTLMDYVRSIKLWAEHTGKENGPEYKAAERIQNMLEALKAVKGNIAEKRTNPVSQRSLSAFRDWGKTFERDIKIILDAHDAAQSASLLPAGGPLKPVYYQGYSNSFAFLSAPTVGEPG